jgi:tetratricopeptide (TPR) repeat protein
MKKNILITAIIILFTLAWVIGPMAGCAKKKPNYQYGSQLKKGTPEFTLNEAIFYLNSGKMDLAEKKLLETLKMNPTMALAINALGIVYLNKRDFPKAIQYFTQVVRTNPEYYDAYNYLGVTYSEMGEYTLAKENLLIAANGAKYQTPENAFANLAMLEIREKKYNTALRYIDKGLAKNDRFAPLSNLKGIVLENEEKYNEALQWYNRAISLLTEPEATYLINIGRVYSKMGQKDKALDFLEKALGKALTKEMKDEIHKLIADLDKREKTN